MGKDYEQAFFTEEKNKWPKDTLEMLHLRNKQGNAN